MSDIDDRRKRLASIFATTVPTLFAANLTEADVRAKLIDPLLLEGLGWPEEQIRREDSTPSGEALDYRFGDPVGYFILEAKRATVEWTLPENTISRSHQIDTLARADKNLKETIYQVARYCQDTNCAFAAAANGRQLLIFRALRTDRPWPKGEVLVFRSPEDILNRFAELWDTLAYPAVTNGSLFRYFSFPDEVRRHHQSVLALQKNADEKLVRNRLSGPLIPIVKNVLGDLTDERHADVLRRCYVYSQTLKTTAENFMLTIKDLPPDYLRDNVAHIRPDRLGAGKFQEAIMRIQAEARRGDVLLLLGGIGAGKTTFLRQVRVKYCAPIIDQSGVFLYLDFRDAPEQPPFDRFVFSNLRRQLNADPAFRRLAESLGYKADRTATQPLESPGLLRQLFKAELDREEALAIEMGIDNSQLIAKRKLTRISALTTDDREVVVRAFKAIEAAGRFVLLAFDNADQLALEYQLQIFLFAQNIAAATGASVIVALREEKYYLASQHGAFSAFQTTTFHIPSPKLREMLFLRLKYALEKLPEIVPTHSTDDRANVFDFIDAILRGGVGFSGNQNVVRLLERICHGDMRSALRMFQSFLQSGNTNVSKVLDIYRRERAAAKPVPYHVPFHEFTKSVMLGDYRYYQEQRSDLVNLFAISPLAPKSHFTATRILSLLLYKREDASPLGRGFVDVAEVLRIFGGVQADVGDVNFHMGRLLKAGLLESNTGVSSEADRYRALRVLPAGEYYLTFLARAFAYVDLVWMDTPIADTATLARLGELLDKKDKNDRFERVDLFLAYLDAEERREYRLYPGLAAIGAWRNPVMPEIKEQIEREKVVISANFAKYGVV